MDQAEPAPSVQRSNSRIRVMSAHVVPDIVRDRRRIAALFTAGTVTETRSREWANGSYRFGADWLTPQARDLLGMGSGRDGDQPPIIQYELPEREFAELSLPSSFGFRATGHDDTTVVVTLHRCGAVFTTVDIVLVWVEVSIDSDDQATWIDVTRAVRHRIRPDDKADYLRRFHDAEGRRLAMSDILAQVESIFIGDDDRTGRYAARNLFTFGRYKLLAESPDAVARFLRRVGRTSADPGNESLIERDIAMSARHLGEEEEASILHVASLDSLSIVLWQLPTERQPAGATAFRNAFHLGDLWLSFVVCIVQFQMLVSLERQMLDLVVNLNRIGSLPHWSVRRIRDIAAVKNRYESVMRSFIQGYWRFGLLQVHSHDRRHRVYGRLRGELSLDQSLQDFHEKLETLGNYVEEQQREFVNWLLVYVPFVSFLVGVFGINVKGVTSEDGMRLETLLGLLTMLTVGYTACVMIIRYLLGDRRGRRTGGHK